jgi:hypothetical protein
LRRENEASRGSRGVEERFPLEGQADSFTFLSSIPDPAAQHHPFFKKEWLDFKCWPKGFVFTAPNQKKLVAPVAWAWKGAGIPG